MKYLSCLLLLLLVDQAMAQDSLVVKKSVNYSIRMFVPVNEGSTANMGFMAYLKDSKLLQVNTFDPYFQRTYLINKDGEAISSGTAPSAYFSPNDNFIVISGRNTNRRDSFNPYGANDLTSALFFGAFNNLIPKLKLNKR